MSIKAIMEAQGSPKRSYGTGHVYNCFKCGLWVRWLGDNEMCKSCQKANNAEDKLRLFSTESAISQGKQEE